MKSKLKAILDDDRGVSPVIGVILMVAITVILAAVIGTFVLGLGDSLNQAPQSTLSVDSGNASSFNVSHDGGDAIAASEMQISVSGNTHPFTNGTISSSEEFGVGDTVTFTNASVGNSLSSGDEVRVRIIHTPSESIILDREVQIAS